MTPITLEDVAIRLGIDPIIIELDERAAALCRAAAAVIEAAKYLDEPHDRYCPALCPERPQGCTCGGAVLIEALAAFDAVSRGQ